MDGVFFPVFKRSVIPKNGSPQIPIFSLYPARKLVFLHSVKDRNLLLWVEENEAFLEIERLNVFATTVVIRSRAGSTAYISPVCYCLFRFIAMGYVCGWEAKLCCHLSILCCASFVFRELLTARRAPGGMCFLCTVITGRTSAPGVCHGDYGLVTVFPPTINYICINKCLVSLYGTLK